MKIVNLLLALGVSLVGAIQVSAQSRPTGRPVNVGQERAAEVKLRNAEKQAAQVQRHTEARKHGSETATSRANEKALEKSNEKSALKQGQSISPSEPKVKEEKKKNRDEGKEKEKENKNKKKPESNGKRK